MNSKEAFLVYPSTLDVLEMFPDERARGLALKIVEYGINGGDVGCSEEDDLILRNVFESIDAQKRRYRSVQRLEEIMEIVETLPRQDRRFNQESIDTLLKALKKLKAQAHREGVDELQIYNVLGPELYVEFGQGFFVLAAEVFRVFRGRINRVTPEERRKVLEAELYDILSAFQSPTQPNSTSQPNANLVPQPTSPSNSIQSRTPIRPVGKYATRIGTPSADYCSSQPPSQPKRTLPTPDPTPICPDETGGRNPNLFTSF